MEEKEVVVEEVVEETVVEEAPATETPVATEDTTSKPAMEVPGNKFALIAFILTVVGLSFALGTVTGLVGMVLGIVGLAMLKKAAADRKPFSVFQKIAKPLGIVSIIVGVLAFTLWLIIAVLVPVIAELVSEAGEALNSAYSLALFAL